MDGITIAMIGLVGNIGGVLLNYHLGKEDKKPNIILVKADHTIGPNRIELTLPIRKSALFSFIFGFAGVFLGGFFSIAGIISAKQALRYIGYSDNDPRSVWFAKAGLKMSYLGIIELLIVIAFVFAHKISNVI
jgi:hypothetical protein